MVRCIQYVVPTTLQDVESIRIGFATVLAQVKLHLLGDTGDCRD